MSQHKLLLVEPPFYRLFKPSYALHLYPLAMGYLSGIVKQKTAWDMMTYNAEFSPNIENFKMTYLAGEGFLHYLQNLQNFSYVVWQEIRKVISDYQPTVLGISVKTQNFASACQVAKLAKEINPDIKVIMGGAHVSMVGKDIFKCEQVDMGARGEGEQTLIEILDAIEHQKELSTIDGLVYRQNNQIFENSPRKYIEDLDVLPFPHAYASEVLKDYILYPAGAFRGIFAIRGCPYNCFFCGSRNIWSRKIRYRSVKNVIAEIKSLQRKGLKLIHFEDDTFGVSKTYIRELCQALMMHCPTLKWSCELHVKLVSDEIISLMKRAGCYLIKLGVESGNNEMLQKIRKVFTIEEALNACQIIKKYDLQLHVFFMVGFPEETEETLQDTMDVMKKIKCDVLIYSIFTPYPGTETFDFCREHGLIDENYDPSLYNHQSPMNCFCVNIKRDRFRTLVSEIEKVVDRKNWQTRFKNIFSVSSYRRMQELGFRKSFQKGIQLFLGK